MIVVRRPLWVPTQTLTLTSQLQNAGSVTDTGGGGENWSNASSAIGENGSTASVVLPGPALSDVLDYSSFGFSLTGWQSTQGVMVEVKGYRVGFFDAGSIVEIGSTSLGGGGFPDGSGSSAWLTHGNQFQVWDGDLNQTALESSGFKVEFQAGAEEGIGTVHVDACRATAYYFILV